MKTRPPLVKSTIALLLAGIAAFALPARANDSTAEIATGGLVLVRNDNIEMRAEDLLISATEINVRYRFFNKSASDVTVLVAFPMPEIRVEEPDQNIALPTEDPVNLLAFTTTVGGKPVTTQVEQRAFAAGLDRTQLLRSLAIPLAPHLQATNDALDKLPKDKWDALVRIGLAEIEEYDAGGGMEKHLAARWGLQTTFYWEQTFPAMAEIQIEHRYQPSVGGSVQTGLGDAAAMKEDWYEEYLDKYCMDKDFLASVERAKREAKSAAGAPYSEERIEYVLKTGGNWAGPIKDFRLVVDKGNADSLVSFCGEGVRKISPTQFEIKKTDFTPEGDFAVLILKKLAPQ
ncbi:MAG: hypothetical protein QOG83_581 [Alphaproteobacteria bacterium]|jgi:hypothetical protein|nr:hypothetical protein [Alphaproteobacteria bacterium]